VLAPRLPERGLFSRKSLLPRQQLPRLRKLYK
jgi:hypothetical protein